MTTQRVTGWLGAVLLACVGLLLATPAQASIRTVTLSASGPSPSQLTIAKGDVVNFVNTDNVSHTIDRTGTNWAFHAVIKAGAAALTPPFGAAGSYGYTDSYTLVAIPQRAPGSITVQAGTATPTPTPTATNTARPGPTTSPAARPTGSPTASPAPLPTRSGTAIGPGLGTGAFPTATPSQTTPPQPDLASPVPGSAATAGPTVVYSQRGLVQGSPHRYGLPAALAVVAIVGVLSLLLRLLLAEPAARRRRTPPAVTAGG